MNAVDTNVLVYVRDPRDPRKQSIATGLVTGLSDGALLWQVACEYVAASRKLAVVNYGFVQALNDVRILSSVWRPLAADWAYLPAASGLMSAYSLSFWDALLVSAAKFGGVRTLYTEDFSGYSEIGGVQILNPFA